MANLGESTIYTTGIYQLETTDAVDAGTGGAGVSNLQAKQLANRTNYLKSHVDAIEANPTRFRNVLIITANTTLTSAHYGRLIVVDGASANITITLPSEASSNDGDRICIVNKGIYKVTVAVPFGHVIEGNASYDVIGKDNYVDLVLDKPNVAFIKISGLLKNAFTSITPEATGDYTVPSTVQSLPNELEIRLNNQTNEVEFRGFVTKGTAGSSPSIVIYILPADKRPAKIKQFAVPAINGSGVYNDNYNVFVLPNGAVTCQPPSSTTLSLDSVRFSLD